MASAVDLFLFGFNMIPDGQGKTLNPMWSRCKEEKGKKRKWIGANK